MYKLTDADQVWNRACDVEGVGLSRPGDLALRALLRFHGRAMNGGVLHALESFSDMEVQAAALGYRFFGLPRLADVLEAGQAALREAIEHGDDTEELERLESSLDLQYSEHVPEDGALVAAFERIYLLQRSEFQSI